ncbi:MAG: hypothetical protein MJE77_07435 [Proteobacteria bacterium]|nr:hypothetical protein [Pseudomonadota bacterium]
MASPRAADDASIRWHDGVHIRGTPIWCDALRARDVCFVSSAHTVPNSKHGQLLATAETLALLGEAPGNTRLAVPYGRPFSLGKVRLELVRSGHGLGSAGLLADVDGRRVLYAGAINLRGGGLGGVADIRLCDTLVLAACYGVPLYRIPPVDQIVARVADFALEVTKSGGTAVLLVTSPSKAVDVVSRLADLISSGNRPALSFFGHRRIYDAAVRLRRSLPMLPRIRRYIGRPLAGHVLLWPVNRRDAMPDNLSTASQLALISGLAMDRDAVARLDVAAAFAWSNQAGYDELISYIDQCGARQVFLTHCQADTLATAVASADRNAYILGPPMQMNLFDNWPR